MERLIVVCVIFLVLFALSGNRPMPVPPVVVVPVQADSNHGRGAAQTFVIFMLLLALIGMLAQP